MGIAFLCAHCGVQFTEANEPPARCPICENDRQYVNPAGQTWTTLQELGESHRNVLRLLEPNLTSIKTEPSFAMGHHALLVQSPHGNVMWDCISLIDDETIEAVQSLGGITAIAISHPHFYDTMVEWSRAFGDVPVYLHAADSEWIMRPDACIVLWDDGDFSLNDEMTLIHCGGHFPGSSVLHWSTGAGGRGVLLTGDTIAPGPEPTLVSFLYSYPNRIPLSADAVTNIARSLDSYDFVRLYGIWLEWIVTANAKAVVESSAARYVAALGAS